MGFLLRGGYLGKRDRGKDRQPRRDKRARSSRSNGGGSRETQRDTAFEVRAKKFAPKKGILKWVKEDALRHGTGHHHSKNT